jgi:hypothetical protein
MHRCQIGRIPTPSWRFWGVGVEIWPLPKLPPMLGEGWKSAGRQSSTSTIDRRNLVAKFATTAKLFCPEFRDFRPHVKRYMYKKTIDGVEYKLLHTWRDRSRTSRQWVGARFVGRRAGSNAPIRGRIRPKMTELRRFYVKMRSFVTSTSMPYANTARDTLRRIAQSSLRTRRLSGVSFTRTAAIRKRCWMATEETRMQRDLIECATVGHLFVMSARITRRFGIFRQ